MRQSCRPQNLEKNISNHEQEIEFKSLYLPDILRHDILNINIGHLFSLRLPVSGENDCDYYRFRCEYSNSFISDSDLRRKMGRAGKKMVKEKYDPNENSRRIKEIFINTASTRRR